MNFSDLVIVYLYAFVPAIILAMWFWWMDRFEREPLHVVLAAFIWGAIGAALISYFWNNTFSIYLWALQDGYEANHMLVTIIGAPFVEEISKGLVLLYFWLRREIDNVADGVLLGVISGLGFAASENVFYATGQYQRVGELAMWQNLWFREIHTTLLHCSATAMTGLMMGFARRFKGIQRWCLVLNGLLLAMVVHGLWNMLGSVSGYVQSDSNIVPYLMKLVMGGAFLWIVVVHLASTYSQYFSIVENLVPEVDDGILSVEQLRDVVSVLRPKGRQPQWHQLRRSAVKLAFYKQEYGWTQDSRLLREIDNQRERIRLINQTMQSPIQGVSS